MKIAIVGAGAAGCVFASFMKMGGAEVYLVDPNREHMDAIRENGFMHFTMVNYEDVREWDIPGFHTAYSAEEYTEKMDYVIYMVKTTVNDVAIRGSLNLYGPDTVAVSLQNGLGNEVALNQYFPMDHIIYGNGTITTLLEGPGRCKGIASDHGSILNFGPAVKSEYLDEKGTALMEVITAGGCICTYTQDIAYVVWKKAMRNIGMNALFGILQFSSYYMVQSPEICDLMKGIWREGCDVANAMGLDGEALYEFLVNTLSYDYTGMKNIISSTGYDMLVYRKPTEIDSLNGALVKYGKIYGIPTPVNATITNIVKGIEQNYENSLVELRLKGKFY